MDNIVRTSRLYTAWAVALATVLYLLSNALGQEACGLISAAFQILCSVAYIAGWQALARRSPEVLPKYYLAASAFRLMAAAVVLLVFCVVQRADVEAIKWFAVVFIVFYLVMLAFDAIFFAKVSKKQVSQ